MTPVFRVLEVYRTQHRRGPILVGEEPTVPVTVGTRLVLSEDPSQAVEVIAVDLPTDTSAAAGRLAIVVTPDLGDRLEPGATFEVVATCS
jgi:hypothetical protein